MVIRLLRESSETPNITNKDDVRMIRYAYGGYNGVVQKYDEELAGSASGGTFRIGRGRVVLHGWEVEIEGDGWTLDLSDMSSGTYYYTIYLEVNAELETAEIKYLHDTAQHPAIDPGDDLTSFPSGTARIPLHYITVSYGSISWHSQAAQVIPFDSDRFNSLEKSLDDNVTNIHDRISKSHTMLSGKISDLSDEVDSRLTALGFSGGNIISMDYDWVGNGSSTNATVGYVAKLGKVIYGYFDLSDVSAGIQLITGIRCPLITQYPPTSYGGGITINSLVNPFTHQNVKYRQVLTISIEAVTGSISASAHPITMNDTAYEIPQAKAYFAYSTDGTHDPNYKG